MTNSLTVKTYDSRSCDINDLRVAWQECSAGLPKQENLFTYEWFQVWMDTYGSQRPWLGRSIVLTVKESNRTVALLPMALCQQYRLTFLSSGGFYQPYRGLLCQPQFVNDACALLATALLTPSGQWDILRLGTLNENEPASNTLLQAVTLLTHNSIALSRRPSIVNDLPEEQEQYLHSKPIKKIFYYKRRLEREEHANYVHYANPCGAETNRLLDDLRHIEKHCWLSQEQGDLRFTSDDARSFWKKAIDTALSPRKQFDAWLAYVNDIPVAFRVVITLGPTSHLIANQYDEHYAKHSLGWILYLEHLEHAYQQGVTSIDMAPGDLHYKGRLGARLGGYRIDVVCSTGTAKSNLAIYGLKARLWLRECANGHKRKRN